MIFTRLDTLLAVVRTFNNGIFEFPIEQRYADILAREVFPRMIPRLQTNDITLAPRYDW